MRLRKMGILLCLLLLLGTATAFAENYGDWLVFQDGATGLYGFINRKGDIVEPARWEEPPMFYPDNPVPEWCVARKEGAYGVVDMEGNAILPFAYESIGIITDGLFAVKKDGKSGVVQRDGSEVLPFAWEELNATGAALETGVLTMRKEGKAGWITLSGEEKCAPMWDLAYPYRSADGKVYVKVRKDRLWGVADIDGNLLIEPLYAYVGFFNESLVPVQKKQKWGYLDEQGEVALPFEYQDAGSFVDTVAWVQKSGEYFYIDHTGKKVQPPPEEPISRPSYGNYTVVEKKGKHGLQNAQGELVMPYTWFELYPIALDDYFLFKRDDAQRNGVIRADGTIVIDSSWHFISYAGGDPPIFLVEKDDACHYYDHEGQLVFSWPQ